MAGIQISIGFPSLEDLRDAFKVLPENLAAKYMGAALREAIKPGEQRLRSIVGNYQGPTKNLLRAVASKVKYYRRNGSAVALAGFVASGKGESATAQGGKVRAGKDRAFHQGLVEFGTKARRIGKPANTAYERTSKNGVVHMVRRQGGYIASSYANLGPFRIVKKRGGQFTTRPQYQKAFFKKSSEPITIPPMRAKAPIRTAFEQTRDRMGAILREQMAGKLENALREIAYRQTKLLNSKKIAAPRF